MAIRSWRKIDFSGGLQTATTRILRKGNELSGIVNGEFKSLIGGVTRRLGYVQVGNTLRANKPALGAFVHRWNGGSRQFMASNDAGDTATVLSYLTGSTWTDLGAVIAPNVRMQAYSHLGEAYVVGGDSTGVYMDPLNIDTSAGYSTVRNLYTAPRGKFIAEYGGQLYMINTQVNVPSLGGYQTYPDRAYRSSPPTGAITFVKGDQIIIPELTNQVPTMTSASTPSGSASASTDSGNPDEAAWKAFDHDKATNWVTAALSTTGTLQYDFGSGVTRIITGYNLTAGSILVTPDEADRAPYSWTFEGSNNGSTWTVLDTQTAAPAWTVRETRSYSFTNSTAYRYFRLNITANQGDSSYLAVIELEILGADQTTPATIALKLDSVRYLKVGQVIDFYKARTDTSIATSLTIQSVDKLNNSITFAPTSFTLSNRDEVWGNGRKGKLSVYWNTDYPTTEDSDFLRIPQGREDFAEFTGWAKTTARLFLFTKNSFYKFDGANFTPVSTTIGSLSSEAIQVIGSWVIFPHYTGLYGYNDSTGQLQLLSRSVKSWFKAIPDANWALASAGVIDNVYKLQVGTIGTYQGDTVPGTLRIVYDFDSNNFSTEFHTRQHLFQFLQVYSNRLMLHFADDTGKLYVDEVGNTDDGKTIPFEIEQGRENFTIDEIKNYYSVYVYTESPRGATVKYSVDGQPWEILGQLESDVQFLRFPDTVRGNDINFKISQHDDGDPISVIMIVVNFNTEAQSYQ